MANILMLDDDLAERDVFCGLLREKGHDVALAEDADQLFALLEEEDFDLVLAEIGAESKKQRLQILEWLNVREIPTEVLFLAKEGALEAAVEACRKGAYDVLARPSPPEIFLRKVRHALERKRLRKQVRHLSTVIKKRYRSEGIVYRSREMKEVLDLVQRVARVDATVLIQGESGTGKELIARSIHAQSSRKAGPFHVIDCGTIPENLLESELFGHRKGAFTGAAFSKKGLFDVAHGGTLLLDEIGEIPLPLQVKLLRVLQEGVIRPLGSEQQRAIDVRILAATNRDLEEEVRRGGFREDLFYRLNVIAVRVPPLRDRPDDILPLAGHFLQKYSKKVGRTPMAVRSASAVVMLRYPWPGNVRELENAMYRATALAPGEDLGVEDLPDALRTRSPTSGLNVDTDMTLEELEKHYVLHILNKHGGNRVRTAEILGIGRNTLWRKLKAYGYSEG